MKIIALMLTWALSFTVIANDKIVVQPHEKTIPIQCGQSNKLFPNLVQEYKEELFFLSKGVNSLGHELYHSLIVNHNTKTWTFIVTNKNLNTACVLSSGDNFTLFTF